MFFGNNNNVTEHNTKSQYLDPTMTSNNAIYVGAQSTQFSVKELRGEEITRHGETFYKISNADQMRSFFMSIVSNFYTLLPIAGVIGALLIMKNYDITEQKAVEIKNALAKRKAKVLNE
tara:strand:- start:2719 stop:3075 length:357 start_codon:yes stop_codon:yes gene_type:complete